MKKILTLAVALCMVLTMLVPFSASAETTTVASGTCSDNITWVLDSDGVLTISGSGEMTNWTWQDSVSWFDYVENVRIIEKVIIEDGVTSIGDSAFWDCDTLTSVTIPNSLKSIGHDAFAFCEGLTSITIGNGVTSIGDSAFEACPNLTSVTIGNSVTSIGNYAFSSCRGLTSMIIPNSVTGIGEDAFGFCDSLTNITIPDSVTFIGDYAFTLCDVLTDVYYTGSESDWANIDIEEHVFDKVDNVTIHYNYVPDNASTASTISVILDGQKIEFDVQPQIINNRTMVPMRAIFEAIGASVEWDGDTQTVTSTKDNTTIVLKIDSANMYVNNTVVPLDSPACLIDDRTLVPVRAVSEAFNLDVQWDGSTQTVYISTIAD